MKRLAMILIFFGLCGCALQTHYSDPWKERIARCGSAIMRCDGGTW